MSSSPKYEPHFYGPVQGVVIGDNNTVTLIFQSGKKLIVPFLAPPPPPYELVGRDNILDDLKQRLFAGGSLALSALNGLPGVGKTALAVALAHDREVLDHFRDGVLWAGLGRKGDAFALLGSWAVALGISSDEIAKLISLDERAKAIRYQIGMRHMLLVVDDAWQSEAALAFKVGGPNCAHLVTTRLPEVAVHFAGEGVSVVHELSETDSLALLARLAPEVTEAEPDIARDLVRAVGGLPLGLILMGNYLRVQALSGQPRRIEAALEQLYQVEERLQMSQPQSPLERHPSLPSGALISLRAVIAISDEAFDEAARRTLRALSTFPPKPNTFSEEAALAVTAESTKALDTLTDYGLLESGGSDRYMLHQTIADYAGLKRIDGGAYERMVTFFVNYVKTHERDYDVLERETGNILAALDAASAWSMQTALVQGANTFYKFLEVRGLYVLAETLLNRARQTAKASGDAMGLVTTLLNLGRAVESLGNYTQAEAYLREGLALAWELGHCERVSILLQSLGKVAVQRGDYAAAEDYSLEGLALAREIDNCEGVSALLQNLGGVAWCRGDYMQAENFYQESLVLAREIEHRERAASTLTNLGAVAEKQGNYEQAEKYLLEGMALAREIGHRYLITALLQNLGTVVNKRGDCTRAEELYLEGLALARECGNRERISALLQNLGVLADNRGDYAQAERYLTEGLALARESGHRERTTALLTSLGAVVDNQGDYVRAEEFHREAQTLAREIGHRWLISLTLNNWGEHHLGQQNLDSAYDVFLEALETAQGVSLRESAATALYGLAQVATARGHSVEARRLAQESLVIYESIGHRDTAEAKELLERLLTVDSSE